MGIVILSALTARVQVHGCGIEVAWWGDRDTTRTPIVLLHEGLGSVAMWRALPDAVAAATGHPVMAYSRLGHGRSDPPPTPHTVEFMHKEAREWLPALLDAEGIDRAYLLGHSDGGSIALIFAAACPARTRGLILEAPHVFVEDICVDAIARMKVRWETTPLRERLARYHDDVDAAFHGWNDVWLDPAFRAWNLEELLPHVTCPVLVIQGRLDHYGTLRQVEVIADRVSGPVETLIFDDCGHVPHVDQRTAVLDAVARMVRP